MKKIYFLLVVLCFLTNVNAQIINFPDANFKAKLLAASPSNQIADDLLGNYIKIDANNDYEIQLNEALAVDHLNVSGSNISNLGGIENFINLTNLNCNYNSLISLNLSSNNALVNLECKNNQLTSLNLGSNAGLYILECSYNQLTNLNLSNCIVLSTLNCAFNQLTSLNVNNNIALTDLVCSVNQIQNLNVNNNTNLTRLNCQNNQLTSLNVYNNILLQSLGCGYNQLINLDVSNNSVLVFFLCNTNQLVSLNVKNGRNETPLNFFVENPNLQYICADESQLVDIQNIITNYNYTNCQVNTYCSFNPGGTYYTIQGNNKYDQNMNGCDALDLSLPNLKFNITNGTISGSLISNTTGNYSIPVQSGTHTITPVLENSSYFAVSPTTVNVTFPTQASPFTQNFCIIADGVHPDLEVTLLPINAVRPGFDATYKIIYKNKGNTTQSGTVNLVFNDSVLDLMVSNPITTSQTINNLSWTFTNLLPFETREIVVTLKVNSPTQTPAVNSGYILNYTTTITSPVIDDLPNDNTFIYNQTVVNSFDPNDKTCLEGATITPTKVGDYVHYMIRFENNGTANAQNIVVKDMIDLAKFDINSIVPIKGSHSFVTNITAGNKVEFVFQNINLPFSSGTNGGYVSFKIKTKSTLVLGNTFTNNASIYFDYNFPIVTNTATTTISAALSLQDFVFSNYFNLYPNPVENVLNISSKENIEISSVNIYNALGQLVLVTPNAQNTKTIDVSSLTSGNYFIKINSDKGTSNTKFIKK